MITRAQLVAAIGGLAVVCGLVAYGTLERETTAPRMGAQAAPALHYLDVATPQPARILLAFVRGIDARRIPDGGIPSVATPPSGMTAEQAARFAMIPTQPTLHIAWPQAHPCQQGRWMLPLDGAAAVIWADLKARCTVAAEDGGAGAFCTDVLAAPALVTSLDATWQCEPDGGQAPPSAPPDGYPGVTP